MQKLKSIAAMVVVMVLCGCASTQRLSDTDRTRAKTVTLSADVKKGSLFLLAPSGANIGLMFGAVGGAAASGSIADGQTAFEAFLKANALAIEPIVREEFEKALRASGKVTIATPAQENAGLPVISLSVPQYGFGVTHLLSSKVVPVVQLKADMTDSSGKLLWSESERMLPSIASPMESTTWEQLRANPKLIEEDWRKASRYLAKKMVDAL